VDMLVLAVPPGGGDSLQGVKKGIVEIADTIVVTKADGDLLSAAKHTAADYRGAMQFLHLVTEDETCHHTSTPILMASAFTGDGLPKLGKRISEFRKEQVESGQLQAKRKKQDRYWMWKNLRSLVRQQLSRDPVLEKIAFQIEQDLDAGRIPPRVAASLLLDGLGNKGQDD
jgi:LAO/AO transport system kinase